MVSVDVSIENGNYVLDCVKATGGTFRLVIDGLSLVPIEKPERPDIDASTAYGRAYLILRNGEQLPEHFVAAWG